uniref:Endothelial differentiation related factor 1 n=1 Tax=Rousettus aegyptiacus TaxID=9407 RepID=A0A7J8IJN7_ROUAE|nr:endothelial differentiation related factor 1 [Rousettus aegyptiacus]
MGRWPEQTAFNHQEHSQARPGDRGAAPRPGDAGGGQGDPAGPAEQGGSCLWSGCWRS